MIQFSNTTTKNGIIQDCEIVLFGDSGYGQISGNANRLLTFTNIINRALDKVSSQILGSDGRWQYDDTNYSDLPIGTTDLVNNVQQYQLSTSHLHILRVEILGIDGKYVKMEALDQSDIQNQAMTEFMNTKSIPQYYDLLGDSIFLYPKPQTGAVTMTAGMKIYFQREPSYFVSTDTTKTPGLNQLFHRLVSRLACLDYAISRQLPQKKDLEKEVAILQDEMELFYTKRMKDERIGFRTQVRTWN